MANILISQSLSHGNQRSVTRLSLICNLLQGKDSVGPGCLEHLLRIPVVAWRLPTRGGDMQATMNPGLKPQLIISISKLLNEKA